MTDIFSSRLYGFSYFARAGRFLSFFLPLFFSFFLSLAGILIKMEREKENGGDWGLRVELQGDKSPSLRHHVRLAKAFRVSGLSLSGILKRTLSIEICRIAIGKSH